MNNRSLDSDWLEILYSFDGILLCRLDSWGRPLFGGRLDNGLWSGWPAPRSLSSLSLRLSWHLCVLALNPQLLYVGDKVNSTQKDLQEDRGCLACLKLIVGEEVFMLLVFFKKKAHKVVVVLQVFNLAMKRVMHILVKLGTAHHVLMNVRPVSEDMHSWSRIEILFKREVKEAEELACLHNKWKWLLNRHKILKMLDLEPLYCLFELRPSDSMALISQAFPLLPVDSGIPRRLYLLSCSWC